MNCTDQHCSPWADARTMGTKGALKTKSTSLRSTALRFSSHLAWPLAYEDAAYTGRYSHKRELPSPLHVSNSNNYRSSQRFRKSISPECLPCPVYTRYSQQKLLHPVQTCGQSLSITQNTSVTTATFNSLA